MRLKDIPIVVCSVPLPISPGYAQIGATLERCVAEYGAPTEGPMPYTLALSNCSTELRDYSFKYSGLEIAATFERGRAVMITFEQPRKETRPAYFAADWSPAVRKWFTIEEVEELLKLNGFGLWRHRMFDDGDPVMESEDGKFVAWHDHGGHNGSSLHMALKDCQALGFSTETLSSD